MKAAAMPQPPHTYCKALAPEIKVVIPEDPKLKQYHIFQQLENDKQKHALENWQWFEDDRPRLQESISRRINRPQEKLMMDQGFYHRLKLENMDVVDSVKKIEDRVRGENIRGRAIQLSNPDDGNRVDNGSDEYPEFNDSDDENRLPYDPWERENEEAEEQGPNATISKPHLLFSCKPGEIDERTVIVKNKGNTAIFYSWERRPVEPLVLPSRKKEGWRLFTVMRGTGSLLPGYQRKFTFKYSSREVGTHLEKWVCRIYPKLKKPVAVVDLKGVTMFDDRFRKWRTSFTRALEYREMMTGVREAIADILNTAGKNSRPPDELRSQEYLYTKAAFDFIRNNLAITPPVFFAPTVFKELEKLAEAVSEAAPKEPDPPKVELVVEEETDRSRRKSKKEKKKKKGKRGSTEDEQEGEIPEKSKKSKRKKSKSDHGASSEAEGETEGEDSGKKSRKKSSKSVAEGESEPSADKESRRKSRKKTSKRKSEAATPQGENESQGGVAASTPQPDGTAPAGSSSAVELSPAAWAGSVVSILEGIRSMPERQHRRHFKKQLNALLETAAVPNHQTSLLLMAMYKSLHQISGDVENVLESITEETGRPIVEQLLQKYYAQIEAEQAAAESVQRLEPAEDPDDMTWPFKDDDSETDWLPEEEKNQVKRERANEMLAFIMKWIHILTEARCILRYGFDKCQDRISDEQAAVSAMIDEKILEYSSSKGNDDDCWKVFDLERKKQHLEEQLLTLPSCQLPNCPNCPPPEEPVAKDPMDEVWMPRSPLRGISILA